MAETWLPLSSPSSFPIIQVWERRSKLGFHVQRPEVTAGVSPRCAGLNKPLESRNKQAATWHHEATEQAQEPSHEAASPSSSLTVRDPHLREQPRSCT